MTLRLSKKRRYNSSYVFTNRCSIIPRVSPPEMKNNMKTLFEDVTENHDLEIKVKQRKTLLIF
jgi:hypothetical protein